VPTVSSDPPSNRAAVATTSFSRRSRLGNAVGSNPLTDDAIACAFAANSSKPGTALS
jgi:hypothetical protein